MAKPVAGSDRLVSFEFPIEKFVLFLLIGFAQQSRKYRDAMIRGQTRRIDSSDLGRRRQKIPECPDMIADLAMQDSLSGWPENRFIQSKPVTLRVSKAARQSVPEVPEFPAGFMVITSSISQPGYQFQVWSAQMNHE